MVGSGAALHPLFRFNQDPIVAVLVSPRPPTYAGSIFVASSRCTSGFFFAFMLIEGRTSFV